MKMDDPEHLANPMQSDDKPLIWRIDLHVHTCYSADSITTLEEIIAVVGHGRLDGLAITDHDEIAGALALREKAPFPVIVGQEVTTTEGDLVGLFLQDWVPPGLSPAETADLIHKQGGLVYVPHPFDHLRNSALRVPGILPILDMVDAIEALNGRIIWPGDNALAEEFAQEHDIPVGAGSDAHTAAELGVAYVEMEPFATPAEFMTSLASGRVCGTISHPFVHLSSTWARILGKPDP